MVNYTIWLFSIIMVHSQEMFVLNMNLMPLI
ncbi:unknown [Azospirillum sp. CAG:239]|nr:unknown [Azospirillum sp. CAG:239]